MLAQEVDLKKNNVGVSVGNFLQIKSHIGYIMLHIRAETIEKNPERHIIVISRVSRGFVTSYIESKFWCAGAWIYEL